MTEGNANKNQLTDEMMRWRNHTAKLTKLALMAAMVMVLAYLESMLPPPPAPVPVRYGLANIVVMYAILFLPRRYGLYLVFVKVMMAFITRGILAGALSLFGSGLAWLGVAFLLLFPANKVSYFILCIISAFLHNLGQILIVWLVVGWMSIAALYPYLLIIALITGGINALLLRSILPLVSRFPKDFLA